MKKQYFRTLLLFIILFGGYSQSTFSQKTVKKLFSSFKLSGDIQTDFLFAENDSVINAQKGDKPLKSNSYLRLSLQNQYIETGLKLAYLKNPLPGFEKDFEGAGITNIFIRGRYKSVDLTVGDFYEQFGNGLIFRTYEERNLGIDNSLRGARLLMKPVKGVYLKMLGGSQRYYFKKRDNLVLGGDVEINLDQWIGVLKKNDWSLLIGNAFVSKKEPDEVIMADTKNRLNFPSYVPANSTRLALRKSGFSLTAEYAYKWNDPSFDNKYVYKNGNALFLSTSYTQRGMSLLFQVKRNENMSYRSVRSRSGNGSFINHLPPFSMQHSYTLAAHYPYATKPMGEWAFQTEGRYKLKKHTTLGGRYGTDLRFNFSYIRSLYDMQKDLTYKKGETGYKPSFFEMGDEIYYRDFNVGVSKKINKQFSFNALYMNQLYNQKAVEGHGRNGDLVYSNIFAFDGKYKFNRKFTLRSELQYLQTKQDQGDWAYAMLEMSLFHKLMISVSDNYNLGTTKIHYPMATVSYNYGSHRLQVGYGRTREGMNCAGGVCKIVPASRGLSISYNYLF